MAFSRTGVLRRASSPSRGPDAYPSRRVSPSPPAGRVKRGLRGVMYEDSVPFKELTPLALKNMVIPTSTKGGPKVCLSEMMEMMACLEKFDQNQGMCDKEIKS